MYFKLIFRNSKSVMVIAKGVGLVILLSFVSLLSLVKSSSLSRFLSSTLKRSVKSLVVKILIFSLFAKISLERKRSLDMLCFNWGFLRRKISRARSLSYSPTLSSPISLFLIEPIFSLSRYKIYSSF